VTVPELTCRELVEVVTDYLEGRMPAERRLRFEEHLAFCDGCGRYLEQMRETIRLTGRLREDDLRPETRDALLRLFRDWKRRSPG
jgi:anti-sigma factor RsiW